MKPIITLAFLCLMACTGCKKNSNDTVKQSPIVGKWLQVKTVLKEYRNDKLQNDETTTFNDPNIYVDFNSNLTGVVSNKQGNTYTTTNFTYVASNTDITLKAGSDTEYYTITTLTNNSLVLHSETTEIEGIYTDKRVVDTYFTK